MNSLCLDIIFNSSNPTWIVSSIVLLADIEVVKVPYSYEVLFFLLSEEDFGSHDFPFLIIGRYTQTQSYSCKISRYVSLLRFI